MLDFHHLSDAMVSFARSSAIGVVLLLLLLALWILLPKASRSRLRLPSIFWVLYLLTLPHPLVLDPGGIPARVVSGIGVFLVLTAFSRCLFLLVVDLIIQGRFGKKVPRIIHDILQAVIYLG